MYNIAKNTIENGRFELSDFLKKIDKKWLEGELTDEEREELVELARAKANPENSYADLQKQVNKLFEKLAEQDKKIQTLEDEIKVLKGETPDDTEEPIEDEYPEYVAPTGGHDAYWNGDKITYNGKRYICIAPISVAVVWSPEVYPAYWQVVEESEESVEQ